MKLTILITLIVLYFAICGYLLPKQSPLLYWILLGFLYWLLSVFSSSIIEKANTIIESKAFLFFVLITTLPLLSNYIGEFSKEYRYNMITGLYEKQQKSDCNKDCSGHNAGYNWAMKNKISFFDECSDGKSKSFIEGCESAVGDGSGLPEKEDDKY